MGGTWADLEARGVTIERESTPPPATTSPGLALGDAIAERVDGYRKAPRSEPLLGAVGHHPIPAGPGGSVVRLKLPAASTLSVVFRHENVGTRMKKWFKA